MDGSKDDIRDDEIRVIRSYSSVPATVPEPVPKRRKRRKWIWLTAALPIIIAGAVTAAIIIKTEAETVPEVYDRSTSVVPVTDTTAQIPILRAGQDTAKAYTELITETVNDIPLDIYIPHNATPTLMVGTPSPNDGSIVFTSMAADIRADNNRINGSFVLKGKPLSHGSSKKGFVAIIDGKVTVGVSENSPLFEEATEKEGYFFRQYPLVDNGSLVENAPRGKSIRKAICESKGEIFIVFSRERESFHDFAQALADFGVSNAVYIVGGEYSYGFWRDHDGTVTELATTRLPWKKYENYIVWK